MPPDEPVQQALLIEDATTEGVAKVLRHNARGGFNYQDEISGWIASWDAYRTNGVGKDRAFWLATDNGGQRVYTRGSERFLIDNLSCSFSGGIQPRKLRKLVGDLDDDGFIQRSFVTYADAEPVENEREPNAVAKNAYFRLIVGLMALDPEQHKKPVELDLFADFVRLEVEEIARDLIGLPTVCAPLREHLRKWKGKFFRLLLTYHAIECVSAGKKVLDPTVSEATAARVKRFFLEFLLPNASRFYTEFFQTDGRDSADAQWTADYILAHQLERVTLRELKKDRDLFEKDPARITDATEQLQLANWLGYMENTRNGGVVWPVNPQVHTKFAERAKIVGAQKKAARQAIIDRATRLNERGLASED